MSRRKLKYKERALLLSQLRLVVSRCETLRRILQNHEKEITADQAFTEVFGLAHGECKILLGLALNFSYDRDQ